MILLNSWNKQISIYHDMNIWNCISACMKLYSYTSDLLIICNVHVGYYVHINTVGGPVIATHGPTRVVSDFFCKNQMYRYVV